MGQEYIRTNKEWSVHVHVRGHNGKYRTWAKEGDNISDLGKVLDDIEKYRRALLGIK